MGKGTITGGGSKGLYDVDFDYGSAKAAALVSSLSARKAVLEPRIVAVQANIDALVLSVGALEVSLNAAIDTYNASEKDEDDKKALEDATGAIVVKDRELREEKHTLALLNLELANIDSDLTRLQGLDLTVSTSVWCVDYTDDATGDVATLEINGEQPTVVIAPGGAAYTASYGEMTSREVMSAEQAYYNAAILPGWQKFKPTYRSGTLTAINRGADTGTVALDAANSSAQNLGINQASTLTDVPIEYMSCNSGAFDVGDEVVVQFDGQSWDNPKVIGFLNNPKLCGPARISFVVEPIDRTNVGGVPGTQYLLGKFSGTTVNDPGHYYSAGTMDPNTGYLGYDSLTDYVWHNDARIRFDVAWTQFYKNDLYWLDMGGYEEETFGTTYDLLNEGDTSTNWQLTQYQAKKDYEAFSLGTFPNPSPPPATYQAITGPVEYEDYDTVWGLPNPAFVPDRNAIDAFIRSAWEQPPEDIYLLIDGVPIQYKFQTIGLPPLGADQEIYMYASSNGDNLSDRDVDGRRTTAIIYARKDLDGIPFPESGLPNYP